MCEMINSASGISVNATHAFDVSYFSLQTSSICAIHKNIACAQSAAMVMPTGVCCRQDKLHK